MTQQFDPTNRGAIFVNDKKAPGSNQPDRTGSINIEGVEYFIDGWLKKSAAGNPFMSISVKRKDKQAAPKQAAKQEPVDDFDSVPF